MAGIFLNSVHYSTPIEPNFQHRIEFGNYNTRWGMIIATVALGIKLSKDWYLQQKENLEIIRKKTRTEIQSQKARIHPALLLGSLDTIYIGIKSGSVHTSSMILNLADLLSYSLYENELDFVPLGKELLELQNLIFIEKLNKGTLIDIELQTEGDTTQEYIAPMIIIKLLEESITLLDHTGTLCWKVSLHIAVLNYKLSVKLSHLNLDEKLSKTNWHLLINNTQNRLSEYYLKDGYQIELNEEKYKTEINLQLALKETHKKQLLLH